MPSTLRALTASPKKTTAATAAHRGDKYRVSPASAAPSAFCSVAHARYALAPVMSVAATTSAAVLQPHVVCIMGTPDKASTVVDGN